MNGAGAAENARATQDDRSNREEFITGAGVGPGLTQSGRVDNGRQRGHHAREHINQRDASLNGNAGVTRAVRCKTDGAEGAAEGRSMHEQPDSDCDHDKNGRLGRNTEQAFLAEDEERRREIREGVHTARDGFGESAEQRVAAQRDDERRQLLPGNEQGIESARDSSNAERAGHREWNRQAGIAPQFAEQNRAQPQQRTDRKIDAARENDRGHHQREQADFDRVPDHVERIVERAEARADRVEIEPLEREHQQQHRFVAEENEFPAV